MSLISQKKKKLEKEKGHQNENHYYRLRTQKTTFRYAKFEVTLGQTYKDSHRKAGDFTLEKTTGSVIETWVAFREVI